MRRRANPRKDVLGFEGVYEIDGRSDVFRGSGDAPMRQSPNTHGYLHIVLYKDGVRTTRAIHILVCEAFHGPRPAPVTIDGKLRKFEVNHKNGDKLDNRPQNLEWLNTVEHSKHTLSNGLHLRQNEPIERGPSRTKLTARRARIIRALYTNGMTKHQLADRFEVSTRTIQRIVHEHAWV